MLLAELVELLLYSAHLRRHGQRCSKRQGRVRSYSKVLDEEVVVL